MTYNSFKEMACTQDGSKRLSPALHDDQDEPVKNNNNNKNVDNSHKKIKLDFKN